MKGINRWNCINVGTFFEAKVRFFFVSGRFSFRVKGWRNIYRVLNG